MFDAYIEAWELRELVLKKEVRPREVAEFFLARIERLNPKLGAFMTVAAERALADAARLEQASAAEAAAMPLYGVAYSLKDLTWTRDIRTTMGSKNYENFRPRADAELAVRLRNAGGILLGKTTTPELGGRPTTEGGLCPPAHNPWNLEFSAGGSSGGAAAQVAAGMGPLAEGTDGGGSIRVPAACCGVVGLKPSRGRISFAPVMGEGWAGFATEGPIARSVRDVALMLDVMAGPALGDPYWAPPPAKPFVSAVTDRPQRLRLGLIAESALGPVDSEVRAALERACEVFRAMGHSVEPVDVDPAKRLADYTRIAISAGIATVPIKDPDAMDPVVRRAWEAGKRLSATDYLGAVARMHNTSREIVQALAPLRRDARADAAQRGAAVGPADREVRGATLSVHPVHVSVQRDRTAGLLAAQRIHQIRTADRIADNRPARRRTRHHRARRGVRGGAAVAGSASAGGLTRTR